MRVRFLSLFLFFLELSPLCASWNKPCYSLELEWLYLFPCVQDTYFVIDSQIADFPSGTRYDIDPHLHSGFRLAGEAAFSNREAIQLRWSHLHAKDSQFVSGANLFTTTSYADLVGILVTGFASSSLDFSWNSIETLYSYTFFLPCSLQLDLLGGLNYVRIHSIQDSAFTDIIFGGTIEIRWDACTWGIGPEIGLEGEWAFYSPRKSYLSLLSLVGRASSSLLICRLDNQLSVSPSVFPATTTNDPEMLLVPSWHAKLGLRALFPLFSKCAHIEIGYECTSYLSILSKIVFFTEVPASFTEYMNCNIHGPYASLTLSF